MIADWPSNKSDNSMISFDGSRDTNKVKPAYGDYLAHWFIRALQTVIWVVTPRLYLLACLSFLFSATSCCELERALTGLDSGISFGKSASYWPDRSVLSYKCAYTTITIGQQRKLASSLSIEERPFSKSMHLHCIYLGLSPSSLSSKKIPIFYLDTTWYTVARISALDRFVTRNLCCPEMNFSEGSLCLLHRG